MKARIYVDASVVGGCEDDEFAEYSVQLMERFVRGDLTLVISTLTAGTGRSPGRGAQAF